MKTLPLALFFLLTGSFFLPTGMDLAHAGAQRRAAAVDSAKTSPAEPASVEPVAMFDAIQDGRLVVRLIPKDSTQTTILFENRSGAPLQVRLPAAFVGRPVLAQRDGARGGGDLGLGNGGGGGGNRGNNNQGGGNSGGNQSFGGGMGGGMMGGGMMGGMGGGMGGMGGFFNVLPDQVRKIKVATVCLEHGKADPRPSIPYEIVAVEDFTKDSAVTEICGMLGRGEITQATAQAAVWHRTDGLTWEQLAAKVKRVSRVRPTLMYFSPNDIFAAARIERIAESRAAEVRSLEDASDDKANDPAVDGQISPGEQQTDSLLPVRVGRS